MNALEELDAFLAHHTKGSDPKGDEEVSGYARELIEGVAGDVDDLNDWIEAIAENWRLERMAHVDRNVLRMAVYELIHKPEVPFKVVINEAIDIAKRYSTSQSGGGGRPGVRHEGRPARRMRPRPLGRVVPLHP